MTEKKFYIWHEDVQTPSNGEAFFGPFTEDEIDERINDAYANLLAGVGNIEVYVMSDEEVAEYYINSREYWMEQLAQTNSD